MFQDDSNDTDHAGFNAARDAVIGYAVGSYLDRTRFGTWVNTNRVIDGVCRMIRWGILLACVILPVWFTVILISQSTSP